MITGALKKELSRPESLKGNLSVSVPNQTVHCTGTHVQLFKVKEQLIFNGSNFYMVSVIDKSFNSRGSAYSK